MVIIVFLLLLLDEKKENKNGQQGRCDPRHFMHPVAATLPPRAYSHWQAPALTGREASNEPL